MNNNFIKLFSTSSSPDAAFFLNDGQVFFYASTVDKYAITGKNLIIGATEIIMNHILNTKTMRVETAVTGKNTRIKRMPVEKFLSGMNSFSFILNVSMVLAKQVLLTNQIIHKNINELTGDENKSKKLSIEYYKIIDRLKEEYDKRKLPWISELIKKHETNLTYKKGEAFYKSSEPTKINAEIDLSESSSEYPRGTIICEENTQGEELYILQSGSIDVLVNNNKVATIEDQGTAFGEMALLLNEKRTATLKAKNNVILTKLNKEDLKEGSENQCVILKDISTSLAKKHYYNIIKITNTNKSIIEKNLANELDPKEKPPPQSYRIEKDLRKLKNDVDDSARKKNADFLQDLISNF